MTKEEEQQFTDQIAQTIMPIAINMTEEQIRQIITSVENENPNLPEGFGNMLFEHIMVNKYNHTNQ